MFHHHHDPFLGSQARTGGKESESNQMRAALETSLGTRAERVLLLTDQCTNRETYGLLGRLNWDLAMLVELAKKNEDAMEALAKALAVIRERWEPETTARNVRTVGEVIRKGKSDKSNEFGKVVKLEEAENQIIIEYEVCARRPNDAHLLIPAIETH